VRVSGREGGGRAGVRGENTCYRVMDHVEAARLSLFKNKNYCVHKFVKFTIVE
jgi:hypothetical protein